MALFANRILVFREVLYLIATELLTVYDEHMRETGVASRAEVHSKGLLHEVVHCWLVSQAETGVWLYFQQRLHSKRDFTGWYDIHQDGCVPAAHTLDMLAQNPWHSYVVLEHTPHRVKDQQQVSASHQRPHSRPGRNVPT